MDKEKIEFDNKFNDFAECSEYYYDELGKLNSLRPGAGNLTRKEGKNLHKRIMKFLNSDLDNLDLKRKANKIVDKTEIKEFNKEFKKEHTGFFSNLVKSTFTLPKKFINLFKNNKNIEVISSEQAETQLLTSTTDDCKNNETNATNTAEQTHPLQQSTSEEVVSIEDAEKTKKDE